MCVMHLPLYIGDARQSFFHAEPIFRSTEDLEWDSDRRNTMIHSRVDPTRGLRSTMFQPDPEPDRVSPVVQPPSSPKSEAISGYDIDQNSPQTPDRDGLWTSALVWKSFGIQEQEKFAKLKLDHHRQNFAVQNPPSIPSTFAEFINYRLDVLENEIRALKSAINSKERRLAAQEETGVRIMPAFGGKNLDEATEVLARAIRPVTSSERCESKELYADAEFITTAEYRVGASLLEYL